MPHPLLPADRPLPIWRREGIRALEARLQALAAPPLMDQAGLATARLALAVAPHARRIWVAAGPGNNGGDGLEAAIHLHRWGLDVQVSLLGDGPALATDARRALARARAAGTCITQGLPSAPPELGPQDLCIDALLGIGGTRAPQRPLLQAIGLINRSPAQVLAIDVPTGLDADSGQALGSTVQADHTLTFLAAKPGLLMGHGRDACGTLWLDPLGLPEDARLRHPPDAELNPPAQPIPRRHVSHKGSRGDVAIVGGESLGPHTGMTGAALLAAQAALHGGAGRVMLSLLGQVGLEHFELEADAAGFAPQQEFRIGKGQAVGLGGHRGRGVVVGQQLGPGAGQGGLLEVVGAVHLAIVRQRAGLARVQAQKRPSKGPLVRVGG